MIFKNYNAWQPWQQIIMAVIVIDDNSEDHGDYDDDYGSNNDKSEGDNSEDDTIMSTCTIIYHKHCSHCYIVETRVKKEKKVTQSKTNSR